MVTASLFSASTFTFALTPGMLGAVFVALIVIWGVLSAIYRWHWTQYGTSQVEVMTMSVVYFTGSGIILALLCIALSAYSLSTV